MGIGKLFAKMINKKMRYLKARETYRLEFKIKSKKNCSAKAKTQAISSLYGM